MNQILVFQVRSNISMIQQQVQLLWGYQELHQLINKINNQHQKVIIKLINIKQMLETLNFNKTK